MTTIASFINSLSPTWRAASVLASAVSVGVAVGVVLVGFTGLPKAVELNTEYRVRHTREFEALVCLLTLPDDMSREQAIRECGL